MPANQDLNATGTTGGDFLIPESPVVVPRAAQPPTSSGSAPNEPLPTAWAPASQPPSALNRAYTTANRGVGAALERVALPQDDAPVDLLGKLVSLTPPWFISLIVHFSIMIFLGLLVLGANAVAKKDGIEVDLSHANEKDNEIYAETLGEQLTDPSQKISREGLEPSKDPVAALSPADLPQVKDPLIGPPVMEATPAGHMPVGTIPTQVIAPELSGREEGMKKVLLLQYGGTKLTEDSVKLGLSWLVRQQRSRGMWSLRGPYKSGGNIENEEAATAMALIAFQGAGYTTSSNKTDPYTRVVTRAWKELLRRQQDDGHFFGNLSPEQHQLYTQALCTIAICELYGMTHDESYLAPAQKAVDYCVKIQSPEGGWRYQPGVDADLSVTGWFAMAMQSARMAGLEVPSPVFDKIGKFLDTVARDEGARYAYQFNAGATKPLTAEGLLSRQYLGWAHDDVRLRNGVDSLVANLPDWNDRNVYYWYYGTQVCHHMEGKDWRKWNEVMRQLLPEHQEKQGGERGSWDPNGDRWGGTAGRLYVTCLSLYTLEVYYRHLPIYQAKAMPAFK
jgi:Prenyltransferase and squalene oxidase repeat